MTSMRRSPPGLRNIRTYGERADAGSLSYKIYMKISGLEMEKAKLDREREGLCERLKDIDARLGEIEEKKAELLEVVGERSEESAADAQKTKKPSPPAQGGLRLKY